MGASGTSMTEAHSMADFWRGRRVLLTGHTGFKGAWMTLWLESLGAEVTGYALAPTGEPNLWSIVAAAAHAGYAPHSVIADVRDARRVAEPAALLEACRALRRLECIVVVTSDKVYENRGEGRAFGEGDRLGGHDPYSNSKACAELVTASYRDSFFADGPPIATARAGNVIGG